MDIGGIEVIETGSRLLMADDVAELTEYIEQLQDDNSKMRELVRALVYASDPSDRAAIICNAAELMAELGVEVEK